MNASSKYLQTVTSETHNEDRPTAVSDRRRAGNSRPSRRNVNALTESPAAEKHRNSKMSGREGGVQTSSGAKQVPSVGRRCAHLPITARSRLARRFSQGRSLVMTTSMKVRGRLPREHVVELVQSAAAGDPRGWDALLHEFGGRVWAVARAHRLCDADAADVAQTAWARLVEHLDDLKDPACVGAWLATTARRECLRVLRHRARYMALENGDLEDGSQDDVAIRGRSIRRPMGSSNGPVLEEMLLADRDRALWDGFERLRPSDRALLRMLMSDPRPAYEDIAAALDVPIGNIGPTRARALERLRRELEREGTLTLLMD